MARPLKEINWEAVQQYMESGCNGIEIAGKFGLCDDTFYIRFKKHFGKSFQDYSGKSYGAGKADLKRMLHAKALNNNAPGNTQMLIWLSKTQLGYREPDQIQTLATNQPQIDQRHRIMELEHALAEAKANVNHRIETVADIHDQPQAE